MKLKALSYYDGDKDTRFGDCIILHNTTSLIVYDCGHARHVEEVVNFLRSHLTIRTVSIVVSHNDGDHTNGVVDLLDYLYNNSYMVSLYSSLYLKSARKILNILDDERRTLPATKKRILALFDKIAEIVEKAQEYNFEICNATIGTVLATGSIVGPSEDEFVAVVVAAIEGDSNIDGETVMNAASVQLKSKLDNAAITLLCGDASPEYLHNLGSYDIIQLPHHGKLSSAESIFEDLGGNAHLKTWLVSDNTGSAVNSGGSDALMEYMEEECFDLKRVHNTKLGAVVIPSNATISSSPDKRPQGVKLG